jgi:N-acetylneuraminic acid mutarotase
VKRRRPGIPYVVCTLVIALACIARAALAQDVWITKAPMPTARYGAAAGVINGKLHIVGGCCVSDAPPVPRFIAHEVYDPASDAWSARAPLPLAVYHAAVGVIDGKLYVAGGQASQDEGGNVTALQVYDPVADRWTQKRPMPEAISAAMAGVIDGKLYVAGGLTVTGHHVATLRVYDPVTDQWSTRASLPQPRVSGAAAVFNGLLHVFGASAVSPLAEAYVYDPVADAWSVRAPLPAVRAIAAAAVVDNAIYVVGGHDGTGPVASVDAYDPATNAWSSKLALPTARGLAGVGTIGGVLYAVGGLASTGAVGVLEAYARDAVPPTSVATATPAPNPAGWNRGNVTVTLSAADNAGGSGVRSIAYDAVSASGAFGSTGFAASTAFEVVDEGITTVTYSASDRAGNLEAGKTLVVRIDKTPPVATLSFAPGVLWPPDGRMAPVTALLSTSDAGSGAVAVSGPVVTSNEAPQGVGPREPDWVVSDGKLLLRAERNPQGSGRIYTITYTVTDRAGNTRQVSGLVHVPHDAGQGHERQPRAAVVTSPAVAEPAAPATSQATSASARRLVSALWQRVSALFADRANK